MPPHAPEGDTLEHVAAAVAGGHPLTVDRVRHQRRLPAGSRARRRPAQSVIDVLSRPEVGVEHAGSAARSGVPV